MIDTPYELFQGRSPIAWLAPILLSTVVLPPRSIFLTTSAIALLFLFLSPLSPDVIWPDNVNTYTVLELYFFAIIAWLGMSVAERAIRDARLEAENKKTILENIADGVAVVDANNQLLSANPALLKMIPEEELKGILLLKLPEKTVTWKRKVFSISASPVPNVGTVLVFRDETRRNEIERAKNAMLATASHELRTPLTVVKNYIELTRLLIQSGNIREDQFDEYLARALEGTNRLEGLVRNILDYAQLQAGAAAFKNEPFNLRTLLERIHSILGTLVEKKNLTYELTVDPNVPKSITGDPERLYQVLINLAGNAVKFTDRGGLKIRASQKGEVLVIQVSDTGRGIPPEQLPDIFEAFRRSSDYAQRTQQGAGLGLSITKQIIDYIGGDIVATSEVGVGSTFTVCIPVGVSK